MEKTLKDICIGLSQIGEKYIAHNYTENTFLEFIDYSIEKGVSSVDSSPGYGGAERLVSLLSNRLKKSLVINSKTLPGLTKIKISDQKKNVEKQIHSTLANLKVDFIDVFYLNKPQLKLLSADVVVLLEKYVRQGIIGRLGLITDELSVTLLQYLENTDIGVFSEINVLHNIFYNDKSDYLTHLRERGIIISTRSPLSDGVVTAIEKLINSGNTPDNVKHHLPSHIIQERYFYVLNLLKQCGIGAKLTDFTICYTISNPNISRVMFGAYKKKHIDQIMFLNNNQMSNREYNRISGIMEDLKHNLHYPLQNLIQ